MDTTPETKDATSSAYAQGKVWSSRVLTPVKPEQTLPPTATRYVLASTVAALPETLTTEFLRGVVEPSMCFEAPSRLVFHVPERLVTAFDEWLHAQSLQVCDSRNITGTVTQPAHKTYTLEDTEMVNFLALLYDASTASSRDANKYERYLSLINVPRQWVGCTTAPEEHRQMPEIQVVRCDPSARLPVKKRATDVGYDLTLISKVCDVDEYTALYDTKLIVQPPLGYYVEVVPRSSLSRSGYMQSNSVGIIDPNYRGTLQVAVTRVNPEATPLKLPFTGFQLILRRAHHAVVREVSALSTTSRGAGGFGSTGGLHQPHPAPHPPPSRPVAIPPRRAHPSTTPPHH